MSDESDESEESEGSEGAQESMEGEGCWVMSKRELGER